MGPLRLEDSDALEAGDEGEEEEGLEDGFMVALAQRQQQWRTGIPAGEEGRPQAPGRVQTLVFPLVSVFRSVPVCSGLFQFVPVSLSAAASSATAGYMPWNHIPDVQGRQVWTGVHAWSGACLMLPTFVFDVKVQVLSHRADATAPSHCYES